MRFALDSNVLIYAEGLEDLAKRERATQLIEAIPVEDLVIPLQVIGEVTRWICTRGKKSKAVAVDRASWWLTTYLTQETTRLVFEGALELMAKNRFQLWDAIILSASAEAKANSLLSEDMQDGFRWRGVTIMNPFLARPALPLRRLLSMT